MTVLRRDNYWLSVENWNPNVSHCTEEARILGPDGRDGGGHMQCLEELLADGSCPNEENHQAVWVTWLNQLTECVPGVHHLGTCHC
jgi:hypothetical protein